MPTPSSNRDNESLSFNSTCPDEQVPRPTQPGWSQPSPPLERIDQLESNNIGSGTGIIGDSNEVPVADASSTLPRLPPAITPDPQPDSNTPISSERDGAVFFNSDGQDDDAKPAEADQNITDTGVTETNSSVQDDRRDAASRSSRSIAHLSTADSEPWEPYGVSQAIRRRLEGGNLRASDIPSPSSMDSEKLEEHTMADICAWDDYMEGYRGFDPTSMRIIPLPPSTYLRPGSRFVGTQQSERQVYDVQVEIKHVDLRESFLCGYLRIQGLTEDHPTLTTYFEGEIIGSKYGFTTKHKSWGASDHIDMSHWAKFAAFHPFVRQAKKSNMVIKEYLQKENIFMRWKEHFLVPDHRVRTIHGASFEGFYYICFNQVEGVVHGIYFHSKSEKFQQLELKHVEDRGCMSAVEFR